MSAKMIGPRLKELRQSMKLSQWKMAELLCVSQSSIDRYERNTARPTAENFLVYADYFDVSLDYIFGRCDEPQGKLYEYKPNLADNPEMKKFVEMCFDPGSSMNEKLKQTLLEMLGEVKQ